MFNLVTNSTITLSAPSNLADWNLLPPTMLQYKYSSCSCQTYYGLNQTTGSPCCFPNTCFSGTCSCSAPATTGITPSTIGVCQL